MIKQLSAPSRLAAVVALALTCAAPALAAHPVHTFNGIVRHVSVNNIKVYDPSARKTMGFVIAPKFHNVFKAGGKTAQLSQIAAGQYVKVYYDRRLLGAPYAKTIYLLDQNNHAYDKH